MNLLHLKYAVEVEKTSSLNKAAETLFVSQPNLSRAIKSLEESIGIVIFKRSYQGMFPTEQGEIFLTYAKNLLAQIDDLEAMYNPNEQNKRKFSISIPRASYISKAFTEFVKKTSQSDEIQIYYRETNSINAINNIIMEDYNLGIIRYQTNFKQYYDKLLIEKGLSSKKIMQYSMYIMMSKNHSLAFKNKIYLADLKPFVQISHGDRFVPLTPTPEDKKCESCDNAKKKIFIFERGSQFDILTEIPQTYMWVSPMPQNILDRYNLVQRKCEDSQKDYIDELVFLREYHFSKYDNMFLREIEKSIDKIK